MLDKNKLGNSKGFTLIELLAVIVILGILMIVTIPAVTKYINSSRKNTFADSAGAYINAARYSLLNDEYDCAIPSSESGSVQIPITIIDIDKGNGKSPYNGIYKDTSYVLVDYVSTGTDDGKLKFSICLVDNKGNGTKGTSNCLVEEQELGKNTISAGKASITGSDVTVCKRAA